MANFVYTEALRMLAAGELNLAEAGADLRVALVMTNTTADTERDATSFAGFTTLDEYDGSGYARQALASQAIVKVGTPSFWAKMTATASTFPTLGAGTRSAQAAIVYKHGGTAGTDIPIAFFDQGGFPFVGSGANIVINWSADGVVQVRAA